MNFLNGLFGSNCSECKFAFDNLKAYNFDKVMEDINCNKCCKCVDTDGNTILHYLVSCDMQQNMSCREILNILLKKTFISDILNKQNNLGETPFFCAVKSGNQYGANMLDNSGADKSIKNKKGKFIAIDDNNYGDTSLVIGFTDIEPTEKNINKLPTINESKINKSNIDASTDFFLNSDLLSDNINTVNVNSDKTVNAIAVEPVNNIFKRNEQLTEQLTKQSTKQPTEQLTKQLTEQSAKQQTEILDTDKLFQKIYKLNNSNNVVDTNKSNNVEELLNNLNKMEVPIQNIKGGQIVYKSSGTRKLMMHSEKDKSDNLDNMNELSILMNNRKNDLHKEVENNILKMLNEEKITIASKNIEASEKNALLIKSFLYNYVKNKSPQLSGMDKIMKVKEMPEHEILTILKDMPDIDKYEKQINKYKEENLKNKEEYLKSKNIISDTSLNEDDLNTEKTDKKVKKTKETKTKTKETKKSKASKKSKK
jgi:hypothetical protein